MKRKQNKAKAKAPPNSREARLRMPSFRQKRSDRLRYRPSSPIPHTYSRTPQKLAIICNAIANNAGRIRAVAAAKMDYSTFMAWIRDDPSAAAAVRKAEEIAMGRGRDYAISCIFKAMPKQWCSAAWWLERKFSDEFGKKVNLGDSDDREALAASLRKVADDLARADSASAKVKK